MQRRLLKLFTLTLSMMLFSSLVFSQGVTTSSMNGKITDQNGEALPGATVIAVHTPSGSKYGNTTDASGFYRIPNMRVGGPYKVVISFVGYENFEKSDVFLTLGQTFRLSTKLSEEAVQLEGVTVTSTEGEVFDGNKTGQATVVDANTINALPTVSRAIGDYARYNPLANIQEDDGFTISLAGQNNRYNSIYIDGAVNNDVFGLSGSGTNGGQTGVQPISIDAIEQFQIAVAPFDVRQSGFAGGSINAVTRSGTNDLEASAYYFWRNQDFAGKTPTDDEEEEREKLANFTAKTLGFRVGGPIIKDKLFFFVNAELQNDETPQPFNFDNYDGEASAATITEISDLIRTNYGYDVGVFDNNIASLESQKFLVKFDYNINEKHKLSLRHSYVKAENLEARNSTSENLNFINGSEFFVSQTNSTAVELSSLFGNKLSNKFTLGTTFVRDDRDPFGDPFPTVRIFDEDGTINFGAERFSTANLLNQNIITINDDLEMYMGKHTLLVGLNFEMYDVGNLFVRNNYGRYTYYSPENFLENLDGDGNPIADEFERSFSQVDNVTGDDSDAIGQFQQMLFGVYVQDEIQISEKFKLTGGLRLDFPIFLDDQPVNEDFNSNTTELIESFYPDLEVPETGQFIKTQLTFSPRVGFNWDINGDQTSQLRGGIGVFTSRLPLVWAGGAYNNYGFNIGEVELNNVSFEPDVNAQEPGDVDLENPQPLGQIDLFDQDFKLPQVLKVNAAIDRKLPAGLVGTLEVLYTKNINNVRYQSLNLKPSTETLTGTPDNRPIFAGVNPSFGGDPIDPTYTGIYLASNTAKGYSYNFAASLTKPFDNGLSATASYSYGDSFSLFDGTSSQNSSQWNGYFNVAGRNNEGDAERSRFSQGHRIMLQGSYKKDYLNFGSSEISLIFNGQSGQPFTYVIGAQNFEIVDDGGFSFNELIYVPANESEINLVDISVDENTITAQQQWAILDAFISDNKNLDNQRGDYAKRNSGRTPFEGILDLRFLQSFYVKTGSGKKNTLQFSVDIFNLTNLLNKDWGRRRSFQFDTYNLIDFEGFQTGTNTPTYSVNEEIINGEDPWDDNIIDTGFRSSRWQMQLGLRYIFGH